MVESKLEEGDGQYGPGGGSTRHRLEDGRMEEGDQGDDYGSSRI